MSVTTDSIDLDWEIEFASNVEFFLQIGVLDINLDYTPQIHSSRDLKGISNILEPNESYPMGLHFTITPIKKFSLDWRWSSSIS